LGLALSGRPPRLVLDSTICGVNPQCVMPERTTLPTIKDVVRSYPLRGKPCNLAGVLLMCVVLISKLQCTPDIMATFVFSITPRFITIRYVLSELSSVLITGLVWVACSCACFIASAG
jgi:hypothetical protein